MHNRHPWLSGGPANAAAIKSPTPLRYWNGYVQTQQPDYTATDNAASVTGYDNNNNDAAAADTAADETNSVQRVYYIRSGMLLHFLKSGMIFASF